MTREEARQILIDAGIEEPSKEAIDNLLAKHNAEVQKQKDETNKYKGLADENEELKKKLENLESQNLSDAEKTQKEIEKSQAKIAELEQQIKISERKKALAEKGIVGEQADKLIDADGKLDIEVLGQIISEHEEQAKKDKEKELLDNTPNPTGGSGGSGGNEETEKNFAKEVASMISGGSDSKETIAKYY